MNIAGEKHFQITGIIPAAGYASRLPKLPCSKEIYPLRIEKNKENHAVKTQVASTSILNHMSRAGANKAFMIIRKEKWDIPQFLEDGSEFNLNLSYIVTPPTNGTIYSIIKALPFIQSEIVLLGFPDIQIYTHNPFSPLLEKLEDSNVDVVLGLFEAENPTKVDMVELNPDGSMKSIEVKPKHSKLSLTWLIAAWKPTFTKEIEGCLTDLKSSITTKEIYIGDVIYKSMEKGCNIQTHIFRKVKFVDIGTTSDLLKVL